MDLLLQDLRHALRTLARSPGFTLVAVVTLGLGIGATTTVYTALERVVLDPLPYPDAGRLVQLKSAVPAVAPGTEWDVSEGAWWFFGREARTIDGLGAYRRGGANMLGPDGPDRVRTAEVSANTLRLLGARATLGRLLDEHDDIPRGPEVAVISDRFWKRQLAATPDVIGTTIGIYEHPVEVIGVMADGVDLPPVGGVPPALQQTDVWLPLRLNSAGPFWNAHTQFRTIARLRAGATLDDAQAEFTRLTARLPDVVPNAYRQADMQRSGFATRVYPLKKYVVRDVSKTLWILFGAIGVVLVIVYANVANLFLVRTEVRRREVAIRTALGAGRGAILRHFLAESLVLALAGGALAMVLALWGTDVLAHLAPAGVPRLEDGALRPDGSVILFALALVLLGTLAIAALPALRAVGPLSGSAAELAQGERGLTVGRQSQRIRSGLVIAQVSLALVLIVGAGLLIESLRRLRAVDLGIQPHGVVTAQLYLPPTRYDSVPKMWRFYDAALGHIRALPGALAAGITEELPLEGGYGCTVQGFEDPAVRERIGQAGTTLCAAQEPTSPGYFEAMGMPIIRGRGLEQADLDHPERGSIVVSKSFAERFWPGEDPIGKGVTPNGYRLPQFYRVVGVVGDVYAESAAGARGLAIYYPVLRIPDTPGWWPNPMTLVVKTRFDDPTSLVPAIQRAIRDVDPAIPLARVEAMDTIVDRSTAQLSFAMTLLAIAAMVALLLAAVGLYGVVSYVVTRRTGEIGIRMALGAEPAQVTRLVVGGSVRLAAGGSAFGIIAALVFSRVLRGLLFGVQPTQPLAYLAGLLLLGAVAALAAYLPARRAARIDPIIALRTE